MGSAPRAIRLELKIARIPDRYLAADPPVAIAQPGMIEPFHKARGLVANSL
jgi:hypothetical protein